MLDRMLLEPLGGWQGYGDERVERSTRVWSERQSEALKQRRAGLAGPGIQGVMRIRVIRS